MTLQEFVSQGAGIPTTAMARDLGISQPYAWRLVNDPDVTPGPLLAVKIERWSKGAVKASDLNSTLAALAEVERPAKRRLKGEAA